MSKSKAAAPKKKIGAPKLVPPREVVIYLRVTGAENARYQATFARSGLRRFSDWVRLALNRESEPKAS
jgi:hypothetical protein